MLQISVGGALVNIAILIGKHACGHKFSRKRTQIFLNTNYHKQFLLARIKLQYPGSVAIHSGCNVYAILQ